MIPASLLTAAAGASIPILIVFAILVLLWAGLAPRSYFETPRVFGATLLIPLGLAVLICAPFVFFDVDPLAWLVDFSR